MVDFKIIPHGFKGIGIIVGGEKQICFGCDHAILQREFLNLGSWHNADQVEHDGADGFGGSVDVIDLVDERFSLIHCFPGITGRVDQEMVNRGNANV